MEMEWKIIWILLYVEAPTGNEEKASKASVLMLLEFHIDIISIYAQNVQ